MSDYVVFRVREAEMRKDRLKQVIVRFCLLLRGLFLQEHRKRLRFLVFALIICFFGFSVFASVSMRWWSASIASRGVVKTLGVGVYWDDSCFDPVLDIDWGIIEPGFPANVTVHVRNEGNVPTHIVFRTSDWDPVDALNFITVSWDYSGEIIQPDENIEVTLSLLISSDAQGVTDFTFNIFIAQLG